MSASQCPHHAQLHRAVTDFCRNVPADRVWSFKGNKDAPKVYLRLVITRDVWDRKSDQI